MRHETTYFHLQIVYHRVLPCLEYVHTCNVLPIDNDHRKGGIHQVDVLSELDCTFHHTTFLLKGD